MLAFDLDLFRAYGLGLRAAFLNLNSQPSVSQGKNEAKSATTKTSQICALKLRANSNASKPKLAIPQNPRPDALNPQNPKTMLPAKEVLRFRA